MIDSVTSQFESAFVDFFNAPTLEEAISGFGQDLNKIIFNMMVDAVVKALIASEAVQDAAKKFGKAINEYLKGGSLEALMDAADEFAAYMQGKPLEVLAMVYPVMQSYAPWDTSGTVDVGGSFPSYQSGGYVPQTGLALLHAGEYVLPKGETSNTVGDINITINTQNGDPRTLARELWDELEYEARRRGVALA
jgi:hypothetical protein